MKQLFTLVLVALAFSGFAQNAFYTQNFSTSPLPAGWSTVDNTGNNAGTWTRKTSAHGFASTTASGGFMIFDSDLLGDDNKAEDADLKSAAINCSAYGHVVLQFQQYFVQYSGSEGKVLVSTDNTNWTEVYSVTTTSANPATISVDISGIAANQATVYLKFNYTGDFDYWWAIDDIKLIEPAALDISVSKITMEKYFGVGQQTVSGVVTNNGYNIVTEFDLGYTVDGANAVIQHFTGLNLAYGETYVFSFTQKASLTIAKSYTIGVSSSAPNNGTDLNPANDESTFKAVALSRIPEKNVLMEEFTTASCVYCPEAATRLDGILNSNTGLVLAQLHAGFGTDAMTITEHSTIAAQYTTSAPAVMVDRGYYDSEQGADIGFYTTTDRWEPYAQARKLVKTPVSIIANNTYNSSTRELVVNVSARFFSAITDSFAINCFIQEDSVSGTGNGYNQANAYNNVSSSVWYQKGNPIVGYQHRHVNRKMFGGAWGATDVIPSTTTDGGVYSKQYTFTFPNGWEEEQITLIALVQHVNSSNKFDRQIMNALELHLNSADSTGSSVVSGIYETSSDKAALEIYPNPAQDVINLQLSLTESANVAYEIYDVVGKLVTAVPSIDLGAGDYKRQINVADLTNGVYFLTLKSEGKVIGSQKFVINR